MPDAVAPPEVAAHRAARREPVARQRHRPMVHRQARAQAEDLDAAPGRAGAAPP